MKKKSLSAKKIILNSFNYIKILKDKKIFKIYKNFEKNFDKLEEVNKVAISVSGGPDSMALCFLVGNYKSKKNNKLQTYFYLVDHGLRMASAIEAKNVEKQLKLKKIKLKILKWRGKKPTSNQQSLSRQKRYELIFKECKKHNIKTVLTAHHQDDLYETFFSRLLRGSGTEGLSSFTNMEKKFFFAQKSFIVARPLLNIKKQDLIYLSQKVFKFYLNDPSNEMEKFQRVRLRKLIFNLKNQGLDFTKLKLTLNNLASTNKTINEIVEKNLSDNVIYKKNKFILRSEFFFAPQEIIFRSFSSLLKKITKNYYPPRGKKMLNLINQLKIRDRLKATLGGTIIEKIQNTVVVSEEKTKKR